MPVLCDWGVCLGFIDSVLHYASVIHHSVLQYEMYQMDEVFKNKVDCSLSSIGTIVQALAQHMCSVMKCEYVIVLQTGMTAKKSRDPLDFDLLYHQQSDVCMLRLFESFMESAPQVVLQLYIMVATNEENFFTGISATVSLVSLCWAIAVYSRIHRRVREDKKVVSWPGVVLQAVWRIGMISSRVVALVLFATVFKAYVFLVIAIHWFVMAVWVFLQNTDFCSSWFEERLFNAVIAVVYIFCFFNLKEGTSRYRVFIFYSVIFVENVFCLILWNFSAVQKGIYTEIGFTIVFGGFFVGE
ncbi:hypothetical protein BSL78_01651 [Apostichopus japonicus]|uniref:XK-related protein n=1 Tax=Stichopus japonicus TaxID=307972 RepID=A0A2G8LMM5_STIJA|nr:hypothetical protein BSL78_01651 [Apostichopus japonicus]